MSPMQIFSKTLSVTAKAFVLLLAVVCFLLAYALSSSGNNVVLNDTSEMTNDL